MTEAALRAARANVDEIATLIDSIDDDGWARPSACAGWRVRDMIAHLGAVATSIVAPTPPAPDAPPMPAERERQHDVLVDRRRSWSVAEVVDEWRINTPKLLDALAGFQQGEAATAATTLPGLGTYPKHMLANALAFDTFCHLRNDLLRPAGPLELALPEPDDDRVRPAVEWMLAGLPQMQGPELTATVVAPITLELTGPGATTVTVLPAGEGELLTVVPGAEGDVRARSSAVAFIAWGTTREGWREHVTLEGHAELATPFLDTLNII
ncbi:maleylpyruvate isomerase family mycothiol-dependent enzyme [Pseudonocardia sp. NPDC049154]|uniref:maleylpyruvate isomerase family mycothiol-dependent enzyme n=1 Tax=Pseudonocardia sp. NPDC049154 TaxID=3155501 RepID=UPI0033D31E2A